MRASFNVLDNEWIPVICADGSRQLLGIRQVISRAHELVEISDPSPMEEYSIYRFLGLLLMDALRPEDEVDIEELLSKGHFDMEKIESYISQCISEGVSFDLFDERRPFLQSVFSQDESKCKKPVSKLDYTIPRETSHTHFDHRKIVSINFTPDKALRLILASYVFSVADGSGYYYNVYGCPPYFGVLKGNTLFETLVATLIPTDYIGISFDSPPVLWRDFSERCWGKRRISVSWLQGIILPTRRIQLIPNVDGTISEIFYSQGEGLEKTTTWFDPYITYHEDKDKLVPLLPEGTESVWRNMCDIVNITGNHASQLLRVYKGIHPGKNIFLSLYAAQTKSGKATFIRLRRYDFSFSLELTEKEKTELLEKCIKASEYLKNALIKALTRRQKKNETKSKNERHFPFLYHDVIDNFDHESETVFWETCRQGEDIDSNSKQLYYEYCKKVGQTVLDCWEKSVKRARFRPQMLAELEENRGELIIAIRKLIRGAAL